MGLKAALRDGRHGVRFSPPERWQLDEDQDDALRLTEVEGSVGWFFYYFPGLHMDLAAEHRDGLRQALEWPARDMFEALFRAQKRDPEERPRTADASWSPLVDVEHLELDGSPALRTVHRMAYEPGREVIMGHLLVPLQRGLFEARVICQDSFTGLREVALFEAHARSGGAPPDGPPVGLPQAAYDDPRHDAAFPTHALSRTRAALRWLEGEAGLRVLEPPMARQYGEAELPKLGCALRPPPRFVPDPDSGTSFHRVSFCGTDGVQRFIVQRYDHPLRPGRLLDEAVDRARRLHEDAGVENVVVEAEAFAEGVLTIVEGDGHLGRLRNAVGWLLDADGRAWSLCLTAMAVVPREVLAAELAEAARSFRLTRPPPQRPWWRPW